MSNYPPCKVCGSTSQISRAFDASFCGPCWSRRKPDREPAGDVIERMCRAAMSSPFRVNDIGTGTYDGLSARTRELWRNDMTAAARVLLDEVCQKTQELMLECHYPLANAAGVASSVRARIERPKTVKEQIEEKVLEACRLPMGSLEQNRIIDEVHCLIAKLKEEGQ